MKTLRADLSKPVESFNALYGHLCSLSDVSYLRDQKIENYISEKVRVLGEIRRLVDESSDEKVLIKYAELILDKAPHIPHDAAEAERYLLEASDKGGLKADYLLLSLYSGAFGYGYEAEDHGVDIERCVQKLSEVTHTAYASYYLALYTIDKNDFELGLVLLDAAVDKAVPEALVYKAFAYLKGHIDGIEKDGKAAYKMFRKAYERCVALGENELDDPDLKYEILYHLGCMYVNGWGVLQNGYTGRCLIIKASERNETAKKYCSELLRMQDKEWYQNLEQEMKDFDIDKLFEGSSPVFDFVKSNAKIDVPEETFSSSKVEEKQLDDDFDPMSMFLDPNVVIEVHNYDDTFDDYDVGRPGKDDKYAKVERRNPKLELEPLSKERIDEIFKPLDSLIGLNHIKKEVRSIVNLVQLNRMRKTQGLPDIPVSMHMVFSGPPGTGKTTVARLVGEILWEVGYLNSGHVIDVSRHDLVGEYIGWTANMTMKALKAAKGGIFFLDEAYMLSSSDSGNDFGQEAIDTINKYMEDNRDDTVVIVAGYKDEMNGFLNSNPGLKSRFKHELDFTPMDKEQLYAVYESFCSQYQLILSEEAQSLLDKVLYQAHRQGTFFKSNARGVRDMFERMLVKQAERLADNIGDIEDMDLKTIMSQDIYTPDNIKDGNVTFLSSKKDD